METPELKALRRLRGFRVGDVVCVRPGCTNSAITGKYGRVVSVRKRLWNPIVIEVYGVANMNRQWCFRETELELVRVADV